MMLKRLPLPTAASLAVTLIAGVALAIVLASGGGQSTRRPSGPAAPLVNPGAPVASATTLPSPKPAIARINPHPVATIAGAPRSGKSPPVPALPNLPADDAAAASQLLVSELGARDGTGEPTVRSARCRAGSCLIAYGVDGHGSGLVFGQQVLIWERLFADPAIQRVTLLVYHANVGPQDTSRLPLYEETCPRSAAAAVVASGADNGALTRLCRVVFRPPAAPGGG